MKWKKIAGTLGLDPFDPTIIARFYHFWHWLNNIGSIYFITLDRFKFDAQNIKIIDFKAHSLFV